jgi:lysophospholipase L1-like esterase
VGRRLSPALAAAVALIALGLLDTTVAHATRPAPGGGSAPIQYVALGDSYSSGEGLSPFLSGSDSSSDSCHRSPEAYPELERSLLGVSGFWFYACSGATTHDVHSVTQYAPEGSPQALHAALATANLVTITIGGNDLDFHGDLVHCGEPWHKHCEDDASFTSAISQKIAELPHKLLKAYNTIRRHVHKHTTVVVLGYPQLFPERQAAQDCVRLHGHFGVSLFDEGEQDYFNHEADIVDNVIAQAAGDEGFWYDSALGTFLGHAQCDPDPYLNGIVASGGGKGSFHPDSAGQRAYATMLDQFLASRPGKRNSAGLPIDPGPPVLETVRRAGRQGHSG